MATDRQQQKAVYERVKELMDEPTPDREAASHIALKAIIEHSKDTSFVEEIAKRALGIQGV